MRPDASNLPKADARTRLGCGKEDGRYLDLGCVGNIWVMFGNVGWYFCGISGRMLWDVWLDVWQDLVTALSARGEAKKPHVSKASGFELTLRSCLG